MKNKDELEVKYPNIAKTVIILIFILGGVFLAGNLIVFYYKYTSASSENNYDLRKKVDYLTYQYVNYFKNVSKYDVADFQSYINDSAIGDIFLLKDDNKNGY